MTLSVNTENQAKIATAGGIPPLVALTLNGNIMQKEMAVSALKNLAANYENQGKIATAGCIPPTVALVRKGNGLQMKGNSLGALWNLTFEHPECPDLIIAEDGLVECLVALVCDGSSAQREHAAGILGFLAQHLDADVKLRAACNGGIASLLGYITNPKQSGRIHEGLSALWGLCAGGGDTVRSVMMQADGHEILSMMANSGNERNKKFADQLLAWLVYNLSEISDSCTAREVEEPICRHVPDRLHSLQEHGVHSLENVQPRFNAVLKATTGKPRLLRVVGAHAFADALAELHQELDLLECHDVTDSWEPQWEIGLPLFWFLCRSGLGFEHADYETESVDLNQTTTAVEHDTTIHLHAPFNYLDVSC